MKGVTEDGLQGAEPVDISIHTPVKGVTLPAPAGVTVGVISIHTPVKGVTVRTAQVFDLLEFQSTHP